MQIVQKKKAADSFMSENLNKQENNWGKFLNFFEDQHYF